MPEKECVVAAIGFMTPVILLTYQAHYLYSGFPVIFTPLMKKLVLSIAFIAYLAVTTGVIVNFHYCMHRLDSWELFATETKECSRCGMETHKSNGCCRDEVKIVKMEVDQKVANPVSFEFPSLDILAGISSEFIRAPFVNSTEQRHHQNHSPPLLTEQDTYLLNCVFRI